LCHSHPTTTCLDTLSLHDALPILPWAMSSARSRSRTNGGRGGAAAAQEGPEPGSDLEYQVNVPFWTAIRGGVMRLNITRRESCADRKSTRLNSSHSQISYAVFCLK